MDREAWRAAVHGITKSCTRLSDLSEHDFISILESSFSQVGGELIEDQETAYLWMDRVAFEQKNDRNMDVCRKAFQGEVTVFK